MQVLLARENGFCFGVKKAVELTEAAAETGAAVHNLGQVVHNPTISRRLAERGVTVIQDVAEATEGVVVIRAHGVPPAVRQQIRERGLECIDATCSLVLRAQRFTKQLADEGYKVVILGTVDHPEVVGLKGFAGDDFVIVETEEEWTKLPKMKKAGVVSQSTQPPWAFTALVAHVATIAQEMKVFNTVCPVTVKRQVAATELATQVRTIVVVGGKNSANTRELVNLARMQGRTAYHIEAADELRPEWLAGEDTVGLIGGCSTPMDTLLEVKQRAESLGSRIPRGGSTERTAATV
jgi:(E)-4-hydroxy-3-methyl-but-2-enyl pyrophosphate reductase